jgi:hypothetical protein
MGTGQKRGRVAEGGEWQWDKVAEWQRGRVNSERIDP